MKKIIAYYLTIGFILNFIWEMSQSGLYQPHFQGVEEFIGVHLKAAFGDGVILLFLYSGVALIYRNWKWIIKAKATSYIIMVIFGIIFSVAIEKLALMRGNWAYNSLMPVIPYVKVGLIPVLQLAIIAPLSMFLAVRLTSMGNKNGKEM